MSHFVISLPPSSIYLILFCMQYSIFHMYRSRPFHLQSTFYTSKSHIICCCSFFINTSYQYLVSSTLCFVLFYVPFCNKMFGAEFILQAILMPKWYIIFIFIIHFSLPSHNQKSLEIFSCYLHGFLFISTFMHIAWIFYVLHTAYCIRHIAFQVDYMEDLSLL